MTTPRVRTPSAILRDVLLELNDHAHNEKQMTGDCASIDRLWDEVELLRRRLRGIDVPQRPRP